MDFTEINKILSDLRGFRSSNRSNKISENVVKKINTDYDGEQGEEGLSFEVYKTQIEGVFVKLEIRTDSYGYNDFVNGATFVREVEKTVKVYE